MKNTSPLIIILAKWPSTSETFVAQEIAGLERRGFDLRIVALRSTGAAIHGLHRQIRSSALYLPSYLMSDPIRSGGAIWKVLSGPAGGRALRALWVRVRSLRVSWQIVRTLTLALRRFGQACVLAVEVQEMAFLYSHFLTVASEVTYYTALIRNKSWGFSAHAFDIWSHPDPERQRYLVEQASWGTVCSRSGLEALRSLTSQGRKLSLLYHGLDFSRFPCYIERDVVPRQEAIRLLTVCRIREKKGLDSVLKALSRLPPDLRWHWTHIGPQPTDKNSAALFDRLKKQTETLGLSDRVSWYGEYSQEELFEEYQRADVFILACRRTRTLDQDGLPNVLMEAQYFGLPCISTMVGGIPELIRHNRTGILVSPENIADLTAALKELIRNPQQRRRLGDQAVSTSSSVLVASLRWIVLPKNCGALSRRIQALSFEADLSLC